VDYWLRPGSVLFGSWLVEKVTVSIESHLLIALPTPSF
jgi:hypothetical protein